MTVIEEEDMVKRVLVAVIVALVAIPSFVSAASAVRVPHPGNLVDIRIVGDGRGDLAQYQTYIHGPQQAGVYYYVEAYQGERYSIRVTNRSPQRIGVVVAVDGRNIISGQKSNLLNNERMYILNAYETNEYEGWRTAMDRTNRFYFTDVHDSYAEKAFADKSAMGTIAIAVFEEVPPPPPPRPLFRKDGAAAPTDALKGRAESDVSQAAPQAGTGYGESTYSPARVVQFKPLNEASQVVVFKYEWPSELCRKGIVSCGQPNRMWPRDKGFAPPPRDMIR
jgi:hypothetical protein